MSFQQEANREIRIRLKVIQEISAALREFNRESDPDKVIYRAARGKLQNESENLQSLLESAIVKCPIMVNAVKVRTRIDTSREDGRLLDREGRSSSERYRLERFLRAALRTEDLPREVEFEFVKHLPYDFSKERAGWGGSFQTVEVANGIDVPAYFSIDVIDRGSRETVALFPEEIQSIELAYVLDSDFTQGESLSRFGIRELKENVAATHYLAYRGFTHCLMRSDGLPEKKWKEEVAEINRNILLPSYATELFKEESTFRLLSLSCLPKSFSGFAARVEEGKPVLYEFEHEAIPRCLQKSDFVPNEFFVSYALWRDDKRKGSALKSYRGTDIIRRLAEEPITSTEA